jgi:DNA-binding transcriptional regulator YiaG
MKTFVFEALGFPVELRNVPMVEVRGVWTPDIDLNVLQRVVLLELAHRAEGLTGNQIRFIRSWLHLSLTGLAHLLGVTHPAVLKWEQMGDACPSIAVTTQRAIRLLVLDAILKKDTDFRNAFKRVSEVEFRTEADMLSLDAATQLVAV